MSKDLAEHHLEHGEIDLADQNKDWAEQDKREEGKLERDYLSEALRIVKGNADLRMLAEKNHLIALHDRMMKWIDIADGWAKLATKNRKLALELQELAKRFTETTECATT